MSNKDNLGTEALIDLIGRVNNIDSLVTGLLCREQEREEEDAAIDARPSPVISIKLLYNVWKAQDIGEKFIELAETYTELNKAGLAGNVSHDNNYYYEVGKKSEEIEEDLAKLLQPFIVDGGEKAKSKITNWNSYYNTEK